MKIDSHRQWKQGTRLMDPYGALGTLLQPTYEDFAWVMYDGWAFPCTVLARDLVPALETADEHW
jgi:hypothetical protein